MSTQHPYRWLPLSACLMACAASQTSSSTTTTEVPPSPAPDVVPPRIGDDEMRPITHAEEHPVSVIEQRNEASPLVTFRVVFSSGSADDPVGREGLTRLTANLMAEGGTEQLTFEELTRRLYPMAARISFHIDRDMTVFTGQVHRDHVAEFYPLFRDVLLHPRFADEDFRRIRTQQLTALTADLRGADDEQLGQEYLQSLIYANHPYGHPTLGTETGIGTVSLEDARGQRAHVFCHDRASVGLAGGYPADLPGQVRTDLAQLPDTCAPMTPLPVPARPSGLHVVVIDKPAASSTAVSIGLPIGITRSDPDFAALQFVTDYLGLHRQSSGVLYQTIREARGLNYGDYAYSEFFQQEDESRFPRPNIQRRQQFASLWLRPVRPTQAHFAIRAALRAVSHTLEQGIPADEFDRVRSFLNSYLSLYVQTESQALGYALDDAWNHSAAGAGYLDRTRAAWAAIDREAAVAVARRYLSTTDGWVAIVAPNGHELADAIAHNAPSPITYETPKPPSVLAEDREIQSLALSVRPDDVHVVPVADVFR